MILLAQALFIMSVVSIVLGICGLIEKAMHRRNKRNRRIGLGAPRPDDRSSLEIHRKILARQ